ncbi:cytochrome c3 family protein [Mucilaginibacter sp.]|uniref:cytochrome c3 family protein n=1 Tax=Mucilaginibacter sp. TaxID=1882438 RepID=UPI003D0E3778
MLKRKLTRLAIFLIPLFFIFSQCFTSKKKEDPRGDAYAGSATCISCHKDVSNSYLHTAHFMASAPADAKTVQGSFAKGANEFVFNPHLKVVMDKRDTGLYQTSYADGKKEQAQRFDIVFGGVKGQSYAYWFTNELFQLPISYNTANHAWINSPGYEPNRVAFERAVSTRCLDCHLSYAKSAPPEVPNFYVGIEGYDKQSLVFSVDCERCHGPAAEHVKFHTENPGEKKPHFMVAFNSLTREQKINMCAVCHSGATSRMLKPTFGFKPGDTLSNYMATRASATPVDYKNIDVHGNQKALLASSKCFMSSNMDCSTCHNTHVNDRDNVTLYAAKCMTCHSATSHIQCKMTGKLSAALLMGNCISCHMPAFTSKTIVVGQSGALVHTHHIGIYTEETQKVMAYLKAQSK